MRNAEKEETREKERAEREQREDTGVRGQATLLRDRREAERGLLTWAMARSTPGSSTGSAVRTRISPARPFPPAERACQGGGEGKQKVSVLVSCSLPALLSTDLAGGIEEVADLLAVQAHISEQALLGGKEGARG